MYTSGHTFQRPMQTYSEMYNEAHANSSAVNVHQGMSMWSSLLVAFAAVILGAFALHAGEQVLNNIVYGEQPEARTVIGEFEGGQHDDNSTSSSLEWSTIAKMLLGVETAHAAPLRGYETLITRQSRNSITLSPGESADVVLRLKNIGTTTWTNNTNSPYVSVYTYSPKYRSSAFRSAKWYSTTQPARLTEGRVAPGEFGHVTIPFTAPQTPGTYTEVFRLAAEDTAWIPGGEFQVVVTVKDPNAAVVAPKEEVEAVPESSPAEEVSADSDNAPAPSVENNYSALRLIQSHRAVEAPGGQDVFFKVGFKNTGKDPWLARELRSANTAVAAVNTLSSFAHNSWINGGTVTQLAAGTVNPGQLDLYNFTFRTPAKAGEYTAKFQLHVAGLPVEGGLIEIPVTVTSDAATLNPITFEGEAQLGEEPRIRVGLWKIDEVGTPLLKSPFAYTITDADGKLLANLPANTQVSAVRSANGSYIVEGAGISVVSKTLVRFEPTVANSYMEVVNREDRPSWNRALNYNTFRDTMEVRYSEKNDKTWLVNELPIEQYVAGVAEISNNLNFEAQKALMTAVRTYAFFQKSGTKHADRHFHVDSKYDQVYKGYAREMRFDQVAKSVRETRGELVTYNGEVVITPYFARSDGRTRAWSEVWRGDKPWLQSVRTEYDAGRTQWGHGVGMSARDLLLRADEEGLNYHQLLQYYYRGTETQLLYK